MRTVKTLQLSFSLDILPREIRKWRGAFIEMAGWQDDVFHNHDNSTAIANGKDSPDRRQKKYYYRYPLIQYRVHRGKATIFAVNEGVNKLQQILASTDWELNWYGEKIRLQIEDLRVNETEVKLTEEKKSYKLFNWVALTQENHKKWADCDGIVERMLLLEKMLTNHLIGVCKSLDAKPKEMLQVKLQLLQNYRTVPVHDVQLLAFNVEFDANIDLPEFIGVGKGVSLGYGWLVNERDLQKKPNNPQRKSNGEVLNEM